MDKVTHLHKLGEDSCTCIQMDSSSDNLVSHLYKDSSKSHSSRDGICNKKTCILASILTLLFAVSSAALVISMVALWTSEGWGLKNIEVENGMKTAASHQVETMVGEMQFNYEHHPGMVPGEEALFENAVDRRRSVEDESAEINVCTSSNATGLKPLAHIVGSAENYADEEIPRDRRSLYSVISRNWQCESDSRNKGNVQGGMIFNRSSGFLEVPTAGIYYVYYQIMFVPDPSKTVQVKTRLVGCIPHQMCYFHLDNSDPYMQTERNLNGRYGNSLSQGGLFHFPAGTKIAIMVKNSNIKYNNVSYHTYMGAHLVDEDLQ